MVSRFFSNQALVGLLLMAALCLSACTTPVEVKTASKRQLELIDNLETAVGDLEEAVISFHRHNKVLIENQGRVAIAQQAIDVAMDDKKTATADQLFETYKRNVQPWVDHAFRHPGSEKRVRELEAQISETTDPRQKAKLKTQLNVLRTTPSLLRGKPSEIAELERVYQLEHEDESAKSKKLQDQLDTLVTQIAFMRSMQARVDTWLSTDVTITQELVDALSLAYRLAFLGLPVVFP